MVEEVEQLKGQVATLQEELEKTDTYI